MQDEIFGSQFQGIAHLICRKIDAKSQPYGLTRLEQLAMG